MYKLITEGRARILVPKEGKVSRKLPVFYNPNMKLARDISIYLISRLGLNRICDPMAASGVRSIRISQETNAKHILANDISPHAFDLMKHNVELGKANVRLSNRSLQELFSEEEGFDYIDIDPFGSPVFHLEPAIASLMHNGILAVTATDLGCLYGKYVKACRRKYSSTPLYCPIRKELGIRILAYKAQIMASKFDKALEPVFCHSSSHYVRLFLRCKNSKSATDKVLKSHQYIAYNPKTMDLTLNDYPSASSGTIIAGPIYPGKLWDECLADSFSIIKHIGEESKIEGIGYYDIPSICKKFGISSSRKINAIMEDIASKGYKASRTHFALQAVRTNMPLKEFIKII